MITVEPNELGVLEFQQYAFDDDDDAIRVIDVWLMARNGVPVDADQRHPRWLLESFTWTKSLTTEPDGRRKLTFDFGIPSGDLSPDVIYTIALSITDDIEGHDPVIGTFRLMTTYEAPYCEFDDVTVEE